MTIYDYDEKVHVAIGFIIIRKWNIRQSHDKKYDECCMKKERGRNNYFSQPVNYFPQLRVSIHLW